MKKNSKKAKIISTIVVVVLLISVIGGYFIYQNTENGEAMATLDMAALYQDEVVELSDIIVGISESGTASLVYEEIDLEPEYEVTEVIAVAGVYVNEGEVLATIDLENSNLDDSSEQQELDEAESALTKKEIEVAEAKVQAQTTYDKSITAGESAETIYNLEMDDIDDTLDDYDDEIDELESEISALTKLIKNGLSSDYGLADAQQDLEEAEANIATVTAEIAVTTDEDALVSLQEKLETYEKAKETAESDIEKAEEDYETAYEQTVEEKASKNKELTSTEKARTTYAASMDNLKAEALAQYETTMSTYNNASALYTVTIEALDEELEDAEELVEELTEALEEEDDDDDAVVIDVDGNLLAPCSGYIMTVTEPSSMTIDGSTIESGLSIIVSDGDYAQIDVSVSQDDISDIYIGMETNIVFDSYEDILITAEVDSLSLTPSGDMTSSVNYTVTVICDIPQDQGMTIFSSMTSTVTFIEAQATDVMAISTNYIIYEDGQQYVYLEGDDGTTELVEVETGFSDGFDVEIVSGLELGDVVKNESAVIGIEN